MLHVSQEIDKTLIITILWYCGPSIVIVLGANWQSPPLIIIPDDVMSQISMTFKGIIWRMTYPFKDHSDYFIAEHIFQSSGIILINSNQNLVDWAASERCVFKCLSWLSFPCSVSIHRGNHNSQK